MLFLWYYFYIMSGLDKEIGSQTALDKIFDGVSGNTVIVALDASSINGPEDGLRNMDLTIQTARDAGANAILGFYGMFKAYGKALEPTSGILNLTLSTERGDHFRKVQIGRVEQARELGLAAVSVHVNTTSSHEPEMLTILGLTVADATELKMPVLAHMYPRNEGRHSQNMDNYYGDMKQEDPEQYTKLVRHAARIAADLGADIIKVPYTGNAESFRSIVDSTYGLPVVMAGGPRADVSDFLGSAKGAMEAGARGVAVGRNFFEHPGGEGQRVLTALDGIVHNQLSVEDAIQYANSKLA